MVQVGVHGNDSLLNAQHSAAGGRRLPAAHRHVASHHPVTAVRIGCAFCLLALSFGRSVGRGVACQTIIICIFVCPLVCMFVCSCFPAQLEAVKDDEDSAESQLEIGVRLAK